jgi:hypothetical protein
VWVIRLEDSLKMRRPHLVLALLSLAAPGLALLDSCGFSARIQEIPRSYDKTFFITAQRCGTPQNQADLIYVVLDRSSKLMTETDPLFRGRTDPITVEIPEPFQIVGQSRTMNVSFGGNAYVSVSDPKGTRGVAVLMDNSASLNGDDEDNPPARIPLTDPFDDRVAGSQNFVGTLSAQDRGTVIAFHGAGQDGLFAKIQPTPTPSQSWFTGNTSLLKQKLGELTGEENGKTPLYDAIQLGVQALRTLPSALRKVLVVFSDGPDNSSQAIFDDAQQSLLGDPQIPTFAIGLGSLLAGGGEQRLIDLTCATAPQGVYLKAPQAANGAICTDDSQCGGTYCLVGRCGEPGVPKRFEALQWLTFGYWKATVSLSIPSGLPSGDHIAVGKLFAYPQGSPRQCDNGACPRGMECDGNTNTCFTKASIPFTVP